MEIVRFQNKSHNFYLCINVERVSSLKQSFFCFQISGKNSLNKWEPPGLPAALTCAGSPCRRRWFCRASVTRCPRRPRRSCPRSRHSIRWWGGVASGGSSRARCRALRCSRCRRSRERAETRRGCRRETSKGFSNSSCWDFTRSSETGNKRCFYLSQWLFLNLRFTGEPERQKRPSEIHTHTHTQVSKYRRLLSAWRGTGHSWVNLLRGLDEDKSWAGMWQTGSKVPHRARVRS